MPDGSEITLSECDGSANVREPKFARKKDGSPRDPYEQVNSLQKMALKQALVGAALQARGGSGLFTQDIEDMTDIVENAPPAQARQNSRTKGGRPASDKQLSFISRKAKAKGISDADLNAFVQAQVGRNMDELTMKEASEIIDALDSYKPPAKAEPQQANLMEDNPFAGTESIDINDPDLPF
jgi:hypothetical protein